MFSYQPRQVRIGIYISPGLFGIMVHEISDGVHDSQQNSIIGQLPQWHNGSARQLLPRPGWNSAIFMTFEARFIFCTSSDEARLVARLAALCLQYPPNFHQVGFRTAFHCQE